jgi:hypothetical protein
MGTRSLTKIYDGDTLLVTLYAQYDGYMSGHGKDLAEILQGKTLVNGYQSREQAAFNGPGCMAASIIAGLKKGIGGYYIQAPEDSDDYVDYVYTFRCNTEGTGFDMKYAGPTVTVTSYGDIVFAGTLPEFCDAAMAPEEF